MRDLHRIYQSNQDQDEPRRRVTDLDMKSWTALTHATQDSICDQIGIYLALAFHRGELTFEFCDEVVNDIFGLITSSDAPWPELFYKIYLAFDDGEYYRNGRMDEDPVETYTRPQIAQIVLECGSEPA